MPRLKKTGTKTKITRINRRVKIYERKKTLSLPDQLWNAYQSTQQPIDQKCEELVHSETKNAIDEDKNNIMKNNIMNVEEKKPTILKDLSVKLDNYLVFPNNWNALTQKLIVGIEINKSMYHNLINAKQILVSCSVQLCIKKSYESNSLVHQIVTADTELEEIIKNLHKQEDTLLNCKQMFDDISLPLQIMNTSFIENTNQERLSNPLKCKEIKLENEEAQYNSFETELQKFQNKFYRMKCIFQKKMQEKNTLISQLKLKLFNMRKHFEKIRKTHKVEKEVNVIPMENQIHQLKTVMDLLHSIMGNITEQTKAANINAEKKDCLIKDLKQQLEKLKDQNKKKDKEIKKLLESAEQVKKEKVEAEETHKKTDKEKDLKINQLMSALNELRRKHDRWITDRYYQKCHSIMLFEKMRQLERNQTAFVNVKKCECKKDKPHKKI